jgi:predicted transcriptional regulator
MPLTRLESPPEPGSSSRILLASKDHPRGHGRDASLIHPSTEAPSWALAELRTKLMWLGLASQDAPDALVRVAPAHAAQRAPSASPVRVRRVARGCVLFTGALLGMILVLAAYGLLAVTAALPALVIGYTRFASSLDGLDHEHRQSLVRTVAARSGLTLSALARELRANRRILQYHLRHLDGWGW